MCEQQAFIVASRRVLGPCVWDIGSPLSLHKHQKLPTSMLLPTRDDVFGSMSQAINGTPSRRPAPIAELQQLRVVWWRLLARGLVKSGTDNIQPQVWAISLARRELVSTRVPVLACHDFPSQLWGHKAYQLRKYHAFAAVLPLPHLRARVRFLHTPTWDRQRVLCCHAGKSRFLDDLAALPRLHMPRYFGVWRPFVRLNCCWTPPRTFFVGLVRVFPSSSPGTLPSQLWSSGEST